MLFHSMIATVRTKKLPSDVNRKDTLAQVLSWRILATTATVKFHYFPAKGFYYVLWQKASGTDRTQHRSHAFVPLEGTQAGDVVEFTVAGFAPESRWIFSLVYNPDPIKGER